MQEKKAIKIVDKLMTEPCIMGKKLWLIDLSKKEMAIGVKTPNSDSPEKLKVYFRNIDCFVCMPVFLTNVFTSLEFGTCPANKEDWRTLPFTPELVETFLTYYNHKNYSPKRFAYLRSSQGAEMIFAGNFRDNDLTWEYVG